MRGGGVGIPLTGSTPTTFVVPVPSQDMDFHHHMPWVFFCFVHWFELRGDCSFGRYWWNC
jgi:hypothetical protein